MERPLDGRPADALHQSLGARVGEAVFERSQGAGSQGRPLASGSDQRDVEWQLPLQGATHAGRCIPIGLVLREPIVQPRCRRKRIGPITGQAVDDPLGVDMGQIVL